MEIQQLAIQGMTCSSCANAIEKGVKKLPGVEGATVNFAVERLDVSFDAEMTSISEIIRTIKETGYEAKQPIRSKEISLPIGGMTCASCVATVEKAIGKLQGTLTG